VLANSISKPATLNGAPSVEPEPWRQNLIVGSTGAPKPLLANAITALRDAPAWQGVLSFDEFAVETVADNAPPWDLSSLEWISRAWSPHDDLLATDWLQRRGIGVTVAVAAQAVETVARDRSFHPVRDYLNSLLHDGKARLGSWLSTCLGAEQTPSNEVVGRAMLVAAVARIFDPGCKVDNVPIFEGPQGARKSTAVKTLFEPWFSDELADLGSKDAAMQARGVWGIEVSELDAMSRLEVSRIKAFITRTIDRFRPPYGSRIIESPRSCVFWGTTNAEGYLKDETGGRRFWPVKVGKIDIDQLKNDRDQLWAEALVLFDANVPWWITKSEIQAIAEHHQQARYVGDPWDRAIADYVDSATTKGVTIDQVLRQALGLEIGRCGQIEMNRVARCLRSLGLSRVQVRVGDKRVWTYRKPVTAEDAERNPGSVTALRPVPAPAPVTQEITHGSAL
jgi:predicted P-loop ATPase